jgi:hypothetical protein
VKRWLAAAGVTLVELHAPGGQPLEINPTAVSSVRAPIDFHRHWGRGTQCVLVMTNGRVNAVIEDCATVMHRLQSGGGNG